MQGQTSPTSRPIACHVEMCWPGRRVQRDHRRTRKAGRAKSLPAYRRAAELDAGNAEAQLGLAGALFKAGRIEESLPAYRRAAELDAGNAETWIALAEALAEAGKGEDAAEARNRALGC